MPTKRMPTKRMPAREMTEKNKEEDKVEMRGASSLCFPIPAAIVALLALTPTLKATEPLAENQVVTQFTVTLPLKYWLYLPPGYEEQDDWPLVIFLHGSGERGTDLNQVKRHGPPKEIAAGKTFPFVMVAPQCPRWQRWQPESIHDLTRQIVERYKIDPKRVYLTGLSMGGIGTWEAAMAAPDLYAAIAPICGGGNEANVAAIKDLPIWVFHGAKDAVVPLGESQKLVDALEALGSDVKFTVYAEADHDSWTETYANPALYAWLLDKSRPE